VERALPPEYRQAETVDRVLREYRTVYAAGWNIRTRPYDGIPEALAELAERRVPMGVLSNKPDDMTRMCVREFFPGISFGFVAGQRPDRPRKPDPAAAEEAAQALGVPAAETLFIGDSGVDMQTARAAGMRAMGVSWGFRSVAELWENGAQAVIDRPGQVLDWIA
jgi:phosphoglycolate phosphatase